MPTTATIPTRAGITTAPTGERHIPASVRPDGTTRREIKVRPGYRPPEDVEVYKNRTAESWKTRGNGVVPGAAPIGDETAEKTAANNKNAKRREARKKAKALEGGMGTDATSETGDKEAKATFKPKLDQASWRTLAKNEDVSIETTIETVECERKVKRLKKKLREARELQEKKAKGEGLLHEQFEKVIRINELIKELEKLGVSTQDGIGDKEKEKEQEKGEIRQEETKEL